jgi:carbamoyl-phosphate synthase/aspartate carbamoyltransferase
MILPSDNISAKLHNRLRTITGKIAVALQISGPMNVQYIVKGDDIKEPADIKVIECNLRASRSLPFVSKTYDIDFIETATRVFLGEDPEPNGLCDVPPKHVCVKFPMFSFQRLLGADPVLGVEMASTGEVACFGENKYEAFLKSMNSIPSLRVKAQAKTVLLSGALGKDFAPSAKALVTMGWKVRTAACLCSSSLIPFFAAVRNTRDRPGPQRGQDSVHRCLPRGCSAEHSEEAN